MVSTVLKEGASTILKRNELEIRVHKFREICMPLESVVNPQKELLICDLRNIDSEK